LSNKPSKARKRDPHYEREAGKYDFPLPSREYVMQILRDHGVPLSFESLAAVLDIGTHEFDAFQRRLGAMQRDGQVMQNRRGDYLIPDKADLIRGRVEGHPDGYGFLVRDEDGPDLFLGPKEMDKVLHGDRVMARIVGVDRRGRPEGKIVEVLERANQRLVGRVHNEHGVMFVVAENRRISQDILLAPGGNQKALAGQVVVVEIIEQPSKHSQPIGKVVEVLGNYADPGMEIEIALRKHELPFEFSREGLAEAKKLPDAVRKSDWKWEGGVREDLRQLPLVTIDGETAKDFDDAVYCERQGKDGKGGFRLVVAIADVSHYVQAGTGARPGCLRTRQLGVFPAPGDPDAAGEDLQRPVLAQPAGGAPVHGLRHGHCRQWRHQALPLLSGGDVFPRAPHLHQVAEALYEEKSVCRRTARSRCCRTLRNLDALYRVLVKARWAARRDRFRDVETQMIFDDRGQDRAHRPDVSRNDAHRIIEECMLAANVCASDFLQTTSTPRSTASTRVRRRRSWRSCASSSRSSACSWRRRGAARQGLRQTAGAGQGAAGCSSCRP
jgi:ribonuclease R